MVAAVVSVPVLVVAGNVFAPAPEIWGHLVETVLPRYLLNTLYLSLGVGTGVLVIGVGTAWLVTMCQFPGRRVFEWALLIPFAVPAYVIAYTYTGLLDFAGPLQTGLRDVFGWESRADYWFPEIRSLAGAVIMMALVLYPYVYLLARAAFVEQSVCALEVSRTLGCGPWRCFWSVALPLARPSIVAGLALALMETLNDLGTVQFFAVDTFTTGIYRTWLGLGEPTAAAQLSAILMIFVFALIALERSSRGGAGFHQATQTYRPLPQFVLRGRRALLAVTACAAPIVLGFLLPALALVKWAVETREWIDASFFRLAWHSLLLAGLTAALAVALAVVLAYGQRLHRSWLSAAAARVASMGYAVPGAVIAVGVMLPFAWIDNQVDAWMRAHLGISTGLLLSGTLAALVFAYLVRFFAIATNTVESGLARVTPSMDGAARTLGVGPGATLRRVHLPMIRASLLTAGMLVFVDVMKELPATLIIRPFNFDTLATRVYEFAVDEQLQEASSASLAILLVGIIPVILLSRAVTRARPGSAADQPGRM
ncbi:MAG: iron ABC transporter permease [Alphaproteobacteria bacterium]|nr:iron ABC transporter permease [Alphaproteobacteria bacterium]